MPLSTLSVYWADLAAEHRSEADLARLPVPVRPYRTAQSRQLSMLSKWLLHYALHHHPPHPDEPLVSLRYHVNGKPYLSDSRYAFSLSHSGQLAACVIAPRRAVGIDIQKRVRLRPGVEGLFLSMAERELMTGEDVLALWSQKEAAYKALGHELDARLTDFQFDHIQQLRCRDVIIRLIPLLIQPNYIGYVAYEASDTNDHVTVQLESL
ncbi:4'-phosphopantetheinyl transferase superfamily protein [Spirosoma aureum]|uniref:4'-phosphopantetheinyl transferase superfamily protein n=1 Tax=Spirosoma aureum TaxID=2692134 RepID=A0A6G9AVI0_9BACT|nr:4'-phosphopantetheinyl transferase superfamily protein [Spirosoma aureum]QIP16346.1 4'-phosphopantetheinyl transferase superfamily protein [Spirosoma aureum]